MMAKGVFQKIYDFVKEVPIGKVVSYGMVAKVANTSPRVVGYALHKNSDPNNIPCHRVVFKDGSLSPGYVFGGEMQHRKNLEKEGIRFDNEGKILREYFYCEE